MLDDLEKLGYEFEFVDNGNILMNRKERDGE